MCSSTRRLPAEWEPQSGVMLTWPHADSDWAPVLPEVEPVFFRIAGEILRRERLLVVCADSRVARRVREGLSGDLADPLDLVTALIPCDDTWARDHGPIGVVDGDSPRLLDFRFNGWGNKYPWQRDDAINAGLAARGCFGHTPVTAVDLVLEGGSIDSDGCGTLLTTRSCLLHPRRNPSLSRKQLEERLHEWLGVDRILWLAHGGLEGDDTDGHIDMLARFAAPDTLLYQSCNETAYPRYNELKSMENELHALRDLDGRHYRTVPLPWPGPKQGPAGQRLPASYANFLVINGAVLVPAYDDPADAEAARQIQACFPGRDIVQIPCLPLLQQYGSLHCLSMQLPQGVELTPCSDTSADNRTPT